MMIVDGCIIHLKGISVASADEITRTWKFDDDCNVIIEGSDMKK